MRKNFILPVLLLIWLIVSGSAFGNEPADSKPKREPPPPQMDSADMQKSDRGMPRHGHKPPPQAYEDCKGKKVGEMVKHTTPEGEVDATCEDSPEGLVARPNQPPLDPPQPPGMRKKTKD